MWHWMTQLLLPLSTGCRSVGLYLSHKLVLVPVRCSSVNPFVGYTTIVCPWVSLMSAWSYPQELFSIDFYIWMQVELTGNSGSARGAEAQDLLPGCPAFLSQFLFVTQGPQSECLQVFVECRDIVCRVQGCHADCCGILSSPSPLKGLVGCLQVWNL